MNPFANSTDEALALEVSSGNHKAFFELAQRLNPIIYDIAAKYTINPSHKDDVYQEGLIGLYKAALTYSTEHKAAFSTYAYICIKNSIHSYIRKYFSKKTEPIRNYSAFDAIPSEPLFDLSAEPERLLIEKENRRQVRESIDSSLSDYERRVFGLFLRGLSYKDIAKHLSTSQKSVDNAIQRIRSKLKKLIK
jgi:RNA polymerase sporulation-specific sigma factor